LGCAANPATGVELQSKRGAGEADAISLMWAVLDRASAGWRGLTTTPVGA